MKKSGSPKGSDSDGAKGKRVKQTSSRRRADLGAAVLGAAGALSAEALAKEQLQGAIPPAGQGADPSGAERQALAEEQIARKEENAAQPEAGGERSGGEGSSAELAGGVEQGDLENLIAEESGLGGALGIETERLELAQASSQVQKPVPQGAAQPQGGAPVGAGGQGAQAGAATGAEGAEAGAAEIGFAPIAVAAVAIAAAASGGGGGAVGAVVEGFVAKGPLSGASVGYDTNNNGVLDPGEVLATTDANGIYKFPEGTVAPAGAKILATGGTYIGKDGNPVSFTGTLQAPPGGTAITPFSTLAAGGMDPAVLSQMLGGRDWNSLTAADFAATSSLEEVGLAIFDQLNAGATIGQVIAALQSARSGGLDLSNPHAALAAITLAASGGTMGEDHLAKINAGLPFNAVAVFDSSGNFHHYVIKESDLGLLGGTDQFGDDDLWVQVEGTILGTAANPIKFSDLQALGVDKVVADDLAPYLRLLGSQVDIGNPGFTIDPSGAAQGVLALDGDIGAIGGTELNENSPLESNLGISMPDTMTQADLANFLSAADWDDPLNLVDDQD